MEADFQQYYNLDVSQLPFRRYARLFTNLPEGSRVVCKYSDFQDWNWDREIQTQILHTLDSIVVMYANVHRKKGTRPHEVPPLAQPDYVEKAKKKMKANKVESSKSNQIELAKIFEKRNNKAKKMEI